MALTSFTVVNWSQFCLKSSAESFVKIPRSRTELTWFLTSVSSDRTPLPSSSSIEEELWSIRVDVSVLFTVECRRPETVVRADALRWMDVPPNVPPSRPFPTPYLDDCGRALDVGIGSRFEPGNSLLPGSPASSESSSSPNSSSVTGLSLFPWKKSTNHDGEKKSLTVSKTVCNVKVVLARSQKLLRPKIPKSGTTIPELQNSTKKRMKLTSKSKERLTFFRSFGRAYGFVERLGLEWPRILYERDPPALGCSAMVGEALWSRTLEKNAKSRHKSYLKTVWNLSSRHMRHQTE